MKIDGKQYRTVWMEDGEVVMIDQPKLPHHFGLFRAPDHRETARAIREMIVRGAPALGQAAAYGMAQVYREAPEGAGRADYIANGADLLRATRPTAQNLFYAIDRVRAAAELAEPGRQADAARHTANLMADEEVAACEKIGKIGATLLQDGEVVLTHCNAGWLACVDWGTALAPVYYAHRAGRQVRVLADETRPRCQGANLTAWELMQEGVPCEIIADNAAGHFMRSGDVNLVITGADRVAANGDIANKIGTYEKAVLAREHGIPFYVAVPLSTFDRNCPDGLNIPIEERDAEEVLYAHGFTDDGRQGRVRLAPAGAKARNPAFDVTPAKLISGLITPAGIVDASVESIARLFAAEA
jgi:S-methyl-5-thioribose-1-phosphate isomerase